MKIIKEIQGLRAVSILAVLIYHLQPNYLSGGYTGVDVFFVISGFLITNILLDDYNSNKNISLKNFYLKRIKRILPLVILTTSATLVVIANFSTPLLYKQYGDDAFYTNLFLVNYRFYFENINYANVESGKSPFLHFWSIAVEEQFYILWPILLSLILTRTKSDKLALLTIAILTISSLIHSSISSINNPHFAFYSTTSRFWELGFGSIISINKNKFLDLKITLKEILGLAGMLLISLSFVFYNNLNTYPGINALAPTIGSVLIIISTVKEPTLISKILSNRLLVFIGNISYSIYLWHWPIIILYTQELKRLDSWNEKLFLIIITFVISSLSYFLVEQPIRKSKFTLSKIALFGLAFLLIPISISLYLINYDFNKHKDGVINLYKLNNSTDFPETCLSSHSKDDLSMIGCLKGDINSSKTVILYGDSHATQWEPAIDIIGKKEKYKLITIARAGCSPIDIPTFKFDRIVNSNSNCIKFRKKALEIIKNEKNIDLIIISSLAYTSGINKFETAWRDGATKTIKSIQAYTKNILILGDTPHPQQNVPICLAKNINTPTNCDIKTSNIKSIIKINNILKSVSEKSGTSFIDPIEWLCFNNSCPAIINSNVIYRDKSHISLEANYLMLEDLKKLISENLSPK